MNHYILIVEHGLNSGMILVSADSEALALRCAYTKYPTATYIKRGGMVDALYIA